MSHDCTTPGGRRRNARPARRGCAEKLRAGRCTRRGNRVKHRDLERERDPRPRGAGARARRSASGPTCSACRRSRRRPRASPPSLCELEGYWCLWHGATAYSGVGLHVRRDLAPARPTFAHPAVRRRDADRDGRGGRRPSSPRSTCRTAARTTPRSCASSRRWSGGRPRSAPPGARSSSRATSTSRGPTWTSTRRSGRPGAIGQRPDERALIEATPRARPRRRRPRARSRRTTASSPTGRRGGTCASGTSAGASTTSLASAAARRARAPLRGARRLRDERSRAGGGRVRLTRSRPTATRSHSPARARCVTRGGGTGAYAARVVCGQFPSAPSSASLARSRITPRPRTARAARAGSPRCRPPPPSRCTELLRTLPGDDVRQIMWRFADRYDLQMLVQSTRGRRPRPGRAPRRGGRPQQPRVDASRRTSCSRTTTRPASPPRSWSRRRAASSPARRTSRSPSPPSSSPGSTPAPRPARSRASSASRPSTRRARPSRRATT